MKAVLRDWLETRLPWALAAVRAIRLRRLARRLFGATTAATRAVLYPEGEIRVLTGPFRGLRYIEETVWGPITPKWLGSYECELHPVLAEISRGGYGRILDLGCAEGYYAVGLAVLCPDAQVEAYDLDFLSRRQARRLAALNAVTHRIAVHGRFDPRRLAPSRQRTLIVCDIEGAEAQCLDPAQSAAFAAADLLVEVHEQGGGRAMQALLRSRFAATHAIRIIAAEDRTRWIETHQTQDPIRRLSAPQLHAATHEFRSPDCVWAWMTSQRGPEVSGPQAEP